MKLHHYLVAPLALMFAFGVATNLLADSGTYRATLISPRLGQVLYPGQHVTIKWQSQLPKTRAQACEAELWLSLDGGRTFTTCITPQLNPRANSFNWLVPNMPSNAAVLDIRFGCEYYYPESYSPQPQSTFVIATAPASH
jgi:hypothetical protein